MLYVTDSSDAIRHMELYNITKAIIYGIGPGDTLELIERITRTS